MLHYTLNKMRLFILHNFRYFDVLKYIIYFSNFYIFCKYFAFSCLGIQFLFVLKLLYWNLEIESFAIVENAENKLN